MALLNAANRVGNPDTVGWYWCLRKLFLFLYRHGLATLYDI